MGSAGNFFAPPAPPTAPRPKPQMNQTAQARTLAMRQRQAMRPPVPNGNTAPSSPSTAPPSPPTDSTDPYASRTVGVPIPGYNMPPVGAPVGNSPAPVGGMGQAGMPSASPSPGAVPGSAGQAPTPGAVPGASPSAVPGAPPVMGSVGMPSIRPQVPGAPPILGPQGQADIAARQRVAMGGK